MLRPLVPSALVINHDPAPLSVHPDFRSSRCGPETGLNRRQLDRMPDGLFARYGLSPRDAAELRKRLASWPRT